MILNLFTNTLTICYAMRSNCWSTNRTNSFWYGIL